MRDVPGSIIRDRRISFILGSSCEVCLAVRSQCHSFNPHTIILCLRQNTVLVSTACTRNLHYTSVLEFVSMLPQASNELEL